MSGDPRRRRYADAIRADAALDVSWGVIPEAVLSLADAEIAQVQDEAEGWAQSSAEAFSAWHGAEAKLARVEAAIADLSDFVYIDDIRAALDGTA